VRFRNGALACCILRCCMLHAATWCSIVKFASNSSCAVPPSSIGTRSDCAAEPPVPLMPIRNASTAAVAGEKLGPGVPNTPGPNGACVWVGDFVSALVGLHTAASVRRPPSWLQKRAPASVYPVLHVG
jgi:hypothetical protein